MKTDYLHNALDELKNAFKDESTMSNVAVSNLIVDEDIVVENIDDQVTDRSCHLMETDKYLVQEHIPDGYNELIGQPGLLDISSVHDDDQEHLDPDKELTRLADMIKGNLSERKKPINTISIHMGEDDDDDDHSHLENDSLSSGPGSSYSSQTDGSLLFNAWNEDYEGNADPDVLKRLMQAKRLPRGLDPYILTQIKRAQIIQKMKELEEDDSSTGSCQVMFNVVCGDGPRIFGDDGSDDGTDGSNSLVISLKEDVSDASLDTEDFMFKKPKKSPVKSPLIPDKQYKPLKEMSKMNKCNQKIPIQRLKNPILNDDQSSGTYEEKEMEYTLQNYVGHDRVLKEVPSEISLQDDGSGDDLSNEETFDDSDDNDIDLDRYALKMKRSSQDDDEIFDDRSVMSEAEAERYQRFMKKRLVEKSHHVDFHKDSVLGYFIQLLADPTFRFETEKSGSITDDTQSSYHELDDVNSTSPRRTVASKSSDDLSLNSIKSKDYSVIPNIIKPTIGSQRFVSELSVAVGTPKPLSPYAQDILQAAPILETGTSLKSGLSYNYTPMAGPLVFSFPEDDENDSSLEEEFSTKKIEIVSPVFDKKNVRKTAIHDDVDLLIDALDLNLQNTTTFPSAEGEEFVVGQTVDGITVLSPTSKYGRIIYPHELKSMMIGESFDSLNNENDSMDGNTGEATFNDIDHSDEVNLKLQTAFSDPEPEVLAEISTKYEHEQVMKTLGKGVFQQTDEDISSASSKINWTRPGVFDFNESSFKEQRRKELAYELKQEKELKQQAREDLANELLDRSGTPRNKHMPLSPRNIQIKDSDSTDRNDCKNELNTLKNSISNRRGTDFVPSSVFN